MTMRVEPAVVLSWSVLFAEIYGGGVYLRYVRALDADGNLAHSNPSWPTSLWLAAPAGLAVCIALFGLATHRPARQIWPAVVAIVLALLVLVVSSWPVSAGALASNRGPSQVLIMVQGFDLAAVAG